MTISTVADIFLVVSLLASWTYATHLISYCSGRASMARDYRAKLPKSDV